jgi:Iron-containing redox enzyme
MINQVVESRSAARAHATRGSALEIVERYERRSVSGHALFIHLHRKQVDLGTVWVLMANLREGISTHFVPWLARVIEYIPDRRIASLIAKQLDDELGNGDFLKIHSVLLDRLVEGLSPWRPPDLGDEVLAPGRKLAHAGGKPFFASNPYEAVGALIVGEIFAEKMDRCLADEMRRQHEVSDEALTWLHVHEVLEVNHADDSLELAKLVPSSGRALAATWRGAVTQWEVLSKFLQDVEDVRHLARRRPG